MRTRIAVLLAGAAMFGFGAPLVPAHAQNPNLDSRWLAYLGCWRSIEIGRESTLCLVPARGAEPAAVDLVTIDSGRVVAAEQIVATGQRLQATRGDCTGWQSAEWSGVSDRVYLRSEETCPGWGTRTGTGLIAVTDEGQLLYIQGSTVITKTGVRVQRYREAAAELELPSEVADALNALAPDLTTTARARAAAAAPLAIEDLAEASRELDVAVVEAWLVARGKTFHLDAERLVALAEAGVPPRITDLMIALSNPRVFAVDARGTRRVSTSVEPAPVYPVSDRYDACAMQYVLLPFSPLYCHGYAFRYPYPYGWYPVSIIYTGDASGAGSGGASGSDRRPHGRVINGRGYQQGVSTSSEVVRTGQPRSTSSGAATPAPSASASSDEQRTAKPRP